MRWTAFWDSFESAIHRSDTLSEIDKSNYLKSLLKGKSYDAIAGLALSTANYEDAIAILKKRFGNRQLIVTKHMETLLSTSVVTSDNHLRDLRRLYDQAEANIRSLRRLGVEPESYGAMLSSVLLIKLLPELHLIVIHEISADDLDMESLIKTFEKEFVARERATNAVPPVGCRSKPPSQPPTSALVSNISGSPACVFYEQSHSPITCSSVPAK